ncbi:elongation of very long chain fatty acids protein 1-like [Argiope bruennichi]|uniref:Elongation of very long chain fatty acids protein n=1 Tax=Argiope bruennichi TaxID=94029 RepID=A0A8T0F2R3_ARGBR|nr:elongation of very long chain fatty acids protein 1-like [Argiope bruennichi]XP_055934805.1 elongation of very long chain fatty acids protein 1-like [Argiope bruennichi]KAF8783208.1 Elongation of very long chain fatty acids like protein [Argiope bruennichi]
MSTSVVKSINHFLFHPDIQQKILIKNSSISFMIILVYILLTKLFGPLLMRHRKPFKLNKLLVIYNFTLSAANFYLAKKCTAGSIKYWNTRCGFKKSIAYVEFMKEESVYVWLLFLLKYVELIDTVFFVLRKKYNQISFLHVFHHSAVAMLFWWILKTNEIGYYLLLTVSINNGIHVIMYLYYGLAAIGPKMQKYLWWKKYLTTLQIIQFVVILSYMLYGFLSGCETLSSVEMILFTTFLSFMLLFLNYYLRNFIKNSKNK